VLGQTIVITGQTATGKTSYALNLTKEIDGELVNFDSRQIFKKLDVVAGKDLPRDSHFTLFTKQDNHQVGYYEVGKTRIWLYDIINPNQRFSSFDYSNLAKVVVEDILKRGKTPIFVGGTHLYLKQILYGTDVTVAPDWQLRKKLKNESVASLQRKLRKINSGIFNALNNSEANNPHRLIRKIEIASFPMCSLSFTPGVKEIYTLGRNVIRPKKIIGLRHKTNKLMRMRIKQRVEERLENGAVGEVKKIIKRGVSRDSQAFTSIGIRQIANFIEGNLTKEECVNEWTLREVQYAHRQLTFMRQDKKIIWHEI